MVQSPWWASSLTHNTTTQKTRQNMPPRNHMKNSPRGMLVHAADRPGAYRVEAIATSGVLPTGYIARVQPTSATSVVLQLSLHYVSVIFAV